jgi:mRNA-degrading endonuclease RelE of RelBE toxin-antitoxin system
MDKIEKVLRTLAAKQQEAMLLLIGQLLLDYRKVPGVQPLTGKKGFFRVRVGQYRIIFIVDPLTKKVGIERIGRRNEKTYKGL